MVTMHPAQRTEEWVVGCTVRLLTTLEETIEGTVFAYDRLSNCLTLTQEGTQPGTLDFRVLKASCVKSILLANRPDTPVDLSLPPIDLAPLTADPASTPPRSVEEEQSVKEELSWHEDDVKVEPEEEPIVEPEPEKPLPVSQSVWGKPRGPIVDPLPAPEPRSRREDPWGTKASQPDPPKATEPPTTLSYAVVSKGVSRVSPVPSPVPPAAPQSVPQGPWGVKNPRITSKVAYAQVASNNAAPAPTTQPEPAKSGSSVGMLTMSLKPRSATRHG